MTNLSTFLAVLTVVLVLWAVVMFIRGNLLVAGVSLLAVSLTIYAREKRA